MPLYKLTQASLNDLKFNEPIILKIKTYKNAYIAHIIRFDKKQGFLAFCYVSPLEA